jgi:hypothetical protein
LCFPKNEDGEVRGIGKGDGFGRFVFRLLGSPDWLRLQIKNGVEKRGNLATDLDPGRVAEFGLRAKFIAQAREDGDCFREILLEGPRTERISL